MPNAYLLPCACGRTTQVGPRQAGETVDCACGARLDVPTIRGLRELEPVAETAAGKPAWNRGKGLVFIGLLLTVASLSACGYFQLVVKPRDLEFTPTQQQLDSIGPVDAWHYWTIVRRGMPATLTGEASETIEQMRRARIGTRVSLGLALAGLAVAASGRLVRPKEL